MDKGLINPKIIFDNCIMKRVPIIEAGNIMTEAGEIQYEYILIEPEEPRCYFKKNGLSYLAIITGIFIIFGSIFYWPLLGFGIPLFIIGMCC